VSAAAELRTERLLLRRWRHEDSAPMAAINADPEVARYLNRPPAEESADVFVPWMTAHWEQQGFGPFALESREPATQGALLGFAGVALATYLEPVAHLPELGWRLARDAWGRGLATEAATAARDHAFGQLGLPRLISIVHPENPRSQSVARKLGMEVERQVWNPVLGRFVDVWALAAPGAAA
jgi:RimJ/RimL family protein N-acetyltransferase